MDECCSAETAHSFYNSAQLRVSSPSVFNAQQFSLELHADHSWLHSIGRKVILAALSHPTMIEYNSERNSQTEKCQCDAHTAVQSCFCSGGESIAVKHSLSLGPDDDGKLFQFSVSFPGTNALYSSPFVYHHTLQSSCTPTTQRSDDHCTSITIMKHLKMIDCSDADRQLSSKKDPVKGVCSSVALARDNKAEYSLENNRETAEACNESSASFNAVSMHHSSDDSPQVPTYETLDSFDQITLKDPSFASILQRDIRHKQHQQISFLTETASSPFHNDVPEQHSPKKTFAPSLVNTSPSTESSCIKNGQRTDIYNSATMQEDVLITPQSMIQKEHKTQLDLTNQSVSNTDLVKDQQQLHFSCNGIRNIKERSPLLSENRNKTRLGDYLNTELNKTDNKLSSNNFLETHANFCGEKCFCAHSSVLSCKVPSNEDSCPTMSFFQTVDESVIDSSCSERKNSSAMPPIINEAAPSHQRTLSSDPNTHQPSPGMKRKGLQSQPCTSSLCKRHACDSARTLSPVSPLRPIDPSETTLHCPQVLRRPSSREHRNRGSPLFVASPPHAPPCPVAVSPLLLEPCQTEGIDGLFRALAITK